MTRLGSVVGSGLAARGAIIVVVVVYALVAAVFSVVMPLGEAPDEVSHYSYVRYLGMHGRLPPPEGAASGEAFQPPLYYAFGALVSFWVPEGVFTIKGNCDYSLDVARSVPNVLLHTGQEAFPWQGGALAWHLVRFLSLAMGAVTVWATYELGRLVFPGRSGLAVAAAALNAFLPEFLFISGAVSNDNLVATLSALTLLQMSRLLTGVPGGAVPGGKSTGLDGWLGLGLLLGLGFWTKLSMMLFWPLALAAIGWAAWSGSEPAARRWVAAARRCLLVFATAALIAAPLAIRNTSAFGDPIGWGLMRTVTQAVAGPLAAADYLDWSLQLFQSFWGRFGGAAHVLMPVPLYAGFAVLTLAALAGGGRLLWKWVVETRRGTGLAARRLNGVAMILALDCLLVVGLLWVWAHTNQGTGQARLAFPALAAASLLFAAGLDVWRVRFGRLGLPALAAAALLAASVWVLAGFLLPLYHSPPRINLADVPAEARRGPFLFGDDIRLVGWQVDRRAVPPGGTVYLTLYWQATGRPREDYWLLLRLQGKDDRPVWDKDGSPSAGRDSTDTWGAGDVIAARHRIALSPEAPAGVYRLLAGLHRFGQWEWLIIRDESGRHLGDTIALEDMEVTSR